MAKNKKTKFSPLFPNNPPKPDDISVNTGVSDSGIHSLIPSLDHRYQTGDASTILFLSKRGMSRSPLAREVLRDKIDQSPFFGMCRFPQSVTKLMINAQLMETLEFRG